MRAELPDILRLKGEGATAVFHGTGGWGATMRGEGCWTGPEWRHEPFRRPPRLASLASSGGGTPKRTFHVLRKPDILFAPDTPRGCGSPTPQLLYPV